MEQTGTYSNIKNIGICNVNYNTHDMGYTKGNVIVEIRRDYYDRTIDLFGASKMDKFKRGVNITVTVPVLQNTTTEMAYWDQDGTTSGNDFTFGASTGGVLTGYLLVIEPKDDNANDLVIYRAVPDPSSTYTYSDNDEHITSVKFDGTIDTSRTDGDLMFKWATSYSWSKSSSSVSK
ncbi:MAG: hypothetical protein ACFFG0_04630 [Candidatus Thorarchaeota archaeon]